MIAYRVTRRGAMYGEAPIVVGSLRAAIRALLYGSPIASVPGERAAFRTPTERGMHHTAYVSAWTTEPVWEAFDCRIGRASNAACTWIGTIRKINTEVCS